MTVTVCLRPHSVERSEWVVALEDCIGDKQPLNAIGASVVPHFEGSLEHRGLRSKIYTVVLSDKVFLFKNMEVGGGAFVVALMPAIWNRSVLELCLISYLLTCYYGRSPVTLCVSGVILRGTEVSALTNWALFSHRTIG